MRADEVARNGALLRKNFGQRFSWAPLAYFGKVRTSETLPQFVLLTSSA